MELPRRIDGSHNRWYFPTSLIVGWVWRLCSRACGKLRGDIDGNNQKNRQNAGQRTESRGAEAVARPAIYPGGSRLDRKFHTCGDRLLTASVLELGRILSIRSRDGMRAKR